MIYKDSQSLLDFLVQVMPDWRDQIEHIRQSPRFLVNGKAAKTLFSLWRDDTNKISNYLLKRPVNVSKAEIQTMERAGLVKDLGDKIEVTTKGKDVIKTMILGDDKSIFEEDGSVLPYETAFANTKRRTKTARKTASLKDAFLYALRLEKNQCSWDDVPEEMVDAVRTAMEISKQRGNWYKKLKHANDNNNKSH
jgi:hypothetical protein